MFWVCITICYVVRFVSTARKRGKTLVASRVISCLVNRGYVVGVVKHSHRNVDLASKDSNRYLRAGADVVVISSSLLGAVLYSKWVDDLESVLKFLSTPIVITEGFKESSTGDAIAVLSDDKEFEALSKTVHGNLIAVVLNGEGVESSINRPIKVFRMNDVERLADLIEEKALDYIESQTPRINCKHCGYESCRAFAKAYAAGKTAWCPVRSDVSLLIDNRPVSMKPFVKNIIRSTVEGLVGSLKGVSPNARRITIEINRV
ncbi:MAG: molybdopterin-guanine dinucleotide biosynthesis protein MobB [Zestosphaera sp.]